jgi:hypothetical protein
MAENLVLETTEAELQQIFLQAVGELGSAYCTGPLPTLHGLVATSRRSRQRQRMVLARLEEDFDRGTELRAADEAGGTEIPG